MIDMIWIGIVCLIVGLLFALRILGIGQFAGPMQAYIGWVLVFIGLLILVNETGITAPDLRPNP